MTNQNPLDIFAVRSNKPMWIQSAGNQDHVMELLRGRGEGSYFVVSADTGKRIDYSVGADGTVTASSATAT